MPTHGVSGDGDAGSIQGELGEDEVRQLTGDIVIHPVVLAPLLSRGIHIESGPNSKVPALRVTLNVQPAYNTGTKSEIPVTTTTTTTTSGVAALRQILHCKGTFWVTQYAIEEGWLDPSILNNPCKGTSRPSNATDHDDNHHHHPPPPQPDLRGLVSGATRASPSSAALRKAPAL